jgi:hypothetical protein
VRWGGWLSLAALAAGCHLALGLEGLDFDGQSGATTGGSAGATASSGGAGNQGGGGADSGGGGALGGGGAGGCSPLALDPPGGQAGDGGGCTDQAGLDDDFDDLASTETIWSASFTDGSRDIELCGPGELRIAPGSPNQYWSGPNHAPYLHQTVCGDFAVITRLRAETLSGSAPGLPFNAAGIVVRDPAAEPEERWVMLSLGKHNDFYEPGTKVYATSPGNLTEHHEFDTGMLSGRLMLCRAQGLISFHRMLDDEADPQTLRAAQDYQMGCCLQVGITAHRYTPSEALRGAFDYVHFQSVSSVADCEQLLANAP